MNPIHSAILSQFEKIQGDAFLIHQLKWDDSTRNIRFEPYRRVGDRLAFDLYEPVYAGSLAPAANADKILEEIYRRFNVELPADFYDHSMSVSDVVTLRQNGKVSSYYTDSFDFVELPGFYTVRKELVKTEEAPKEKTSVKELLQSAQAPHQPKPQKNMPDKGMEAR